MRPDGGSNPASGGRSGASHAYGTGNAVGFVNVTSFAELDPPAVTLPSISLNPGPPGRPSGGAFFWGFNQPAIQRAGATRSQIRQLQGQRQKPVGVAQPRDAIACFL